MTDPRPPDPPDRDQVEAGLGVLAALREDVASGHLTSLRVLVSAEIFSDFMEMAERLLEGGYFHAAASIAGAVVEDALRRMLAERGAKATGNLESMNQVAMDTGLYSRTVFLQVKVWIGVRNDADHGRWDAVEQAAVRSMIRDIPTFLVQQLGIG